MELLNKIPFNGYKTYITAGLTILYGVSGYLTGNLENDMATGFILAGVMAISGAHKLDKIK